jgi:hypothetical protein
MNIYKVEQNGQYETYKVLFVVADDEEEARYMKPNFATNFSVILYEKLWGYANPEHFTVTLFLPAEPEDVKGVMYSCF